MRKHKLTHKERTRLAYVFLGMLIAVEAASAWHMISGHDAIAGSLVLTAWGKDLLRSVTEHVI